MRSRVREGISLLEILLAAFVTGVAVLPVLTVLLSSGSSLRQTLPYYQSVFLSELAIEEARLGSSEDPFYLDRLIADGYGRDRSPVVQGKHPFLFALEDTRPPFGRIQPGVDATIDPTMGPLFSFTAPLSMKVAASIGPGETPDLQEATVQATFDWRDGRGKDMEYSLATPILVGTPIGKIETGSPPGDDAALGEVLAPGSGRGLAWLARDRKADPAKLEAFARLLVLGEALGEALGRHAAAIKETGRQLAEAADPRSRARLACTASDAHEATAAEALGLLQAARPDVQELARGLPADCLGSPVPIRAVFLREAAAVESGLQGFLDSLVLAVQATLQAASEPGLGVAEYLQIHRRLVRLTMMSALSSDWPARADFKLLLGQLRSSYEGRMPNIVHWLSCEEFVVDNPETSYPLQPAVNDVAELRKSVPVACTGLRRYAMRIP